MARRFRLRIRWARRFWLFGQVTLVAALAPHIFRLRLSTVRRLLTGASRVRGRPGAGARRIVCYVTLAQRSCPLVKTGCLTRAVTLFHFLRRAGYEVCLCFGTGQTNGEFAAHSWLELDGTPFLEKQDPRPLFTEIFRIPDETQPATALGGHPEVAAGALT